MTRRHRTSPAPLPSSTSRSRWSIPDEDLDDDITTIPDNSNDHWDDNSESDNEPSQRLSRSAMCKRRSRDPFMSRLGNWVAATQSPHTLAQHLYCEHHEVDCVSECLNVCIRPLMYIFTRGSIQTKLVSNWFQGTVESWGDSIPLVTKWQATSSGQNTMPRQPFQAFRSWSGHMWSL